VGSCDFDLDEATMTEDRWLSVMEIAEYLGVRRETVYKWLERKNMPAHKVGRLWKFKRDEVDQWVRGGKAAISDSDSTNVEPKTK